MRAIFSHCVRAFVALVVLVWSTSADLSAQSVQAQDSSRIRRQIEREFGSPVTERELVERIREMGITREQARARLQQMGYDPALADRYFDRADQNQTGPDTPVNAQISEAMHAIGVTLRPGRMDSLQSRMPFDSLSTLAGDSLLVADTVATDSLKVFGLDVFRRFTTQFEPVTTGPVDPGYRLGPGDQIAVVLTGDVELAHMLDVTREGHIIIPQVGKVFVAGLTLDELEDQLYDRIGRRYSGLRRGSDAPIRLQVSLGALRTSMVYVVGEAVRPGAYQVSSVGTVLNALYLAGGPSDGGSLRNIEIHRAGRVVGTIDLYDYLVNGDTRGDIRLEHGDVVFVPVTGPRARIQGAVRRPAIYEILAGESVSDLVRFAGGFASSAVARRVQIDRVLPPEARVPGVDRVLLDVDPNGEPVALRDGDAVQVFDLSTERRNRVALTGAVHRPGMYQWSAGMTLGDLLARAEGLNEQAYHGRLHVYRLNAADGLRQLFAVSPEESGFALADRDSVVVLSGAELAVARQVAIDGSVKNPGTYDLAEGMTLQDLILAAGGFSRGANMFHAEIASLPRENGQDVSIRVVDLGGVSDSVAAGVIRWSDEVQGVRLLHGDRVSVVRSQPRDSIGSVVVDGEVAHPGSYALGFGNRRLLSVIERSGGLAPQAWVEGIHVRRGGVAINIDFQEALRRPKTNKNLPLEHGDTIVVPTYNGTVYVTGAVGFEARVRFEPGKGLGYYIEQAGGYAANADRRRVSVTAANGHREMVSVRAFLPDSHPTPTPGSHVHVPVKLANVREGVNWGDVLTRASSVIATVATLIIAVQN